MEAVMILNLKDFLAHVLSQLKKVSTWVKSIGAMVVGGGVNSILAVYTAGVTISFDHDGLRALRNVFLSGCFLALLMYWTTNSPFLRPKPPAAPPAP
jgi:hypothetical protein